MSSLSNWHIYFLDTTSPFNESKKAAIFFKYLFSLFCFFSLHGQWPIQHMVDSVDSNNFLSTAACQIVLKLYSKM